MRLHGRINAVKLRFYRLPHNKLAEIHIELLANRPDNPTIGGRFTSRSSKAMAAG